MQDPLIKYIEKGLSKGFNINHIKKTLVNYGHNKNRIDEAANLVSYMKERAAKPKKEQNFKPYILIVLVIAFIGIVLGGSIYMQNRETTGMVITDIEDIKKDDFVNKMNEIGELSTIIDEKQKLIEEQIYNIDDLNTTLEEKEIIINTQIEELKILNEHIKEERSKLKELMLELINTILMR